jgi:hypothetical protein
LLWLIVPRRNKKAVAKNLNALRHETRLTTTAAVRYVLQALSK